MYVCVKCVTCFSEKLILGGNFSMWDKIVTINTYGFSRSHIHVSIHFRCGSLLPKFFPPPIPALFIELCCLSSAVLYISVKTASVCVSVWTFIHQLTLSASYIFMRPVPTCPVGHMSYWVVWTSLPSPFHISGESRPFSKFFSLLGFILWCKDFPH